MLAPSILLTSTMLLTFSSPTTRGDKRVNDDYLPVLRDAAAYGDFWVAVHVAEYLIELGYTKQASRVCAEQLVAHESTPQERIGLWRVQYRLESQAARKQALLNNIINAYETADGPDRVHAAETLAKLRYCFHQLDTQTVIDDSSRNDMLGTFVKWGLCIACQPDIPDNPTPLITLLGTSAEERRLAAYGLTFLSPPSPEQWQHLAEAALLEKNKEVRPYLVSAAYQLYDTRLNTLPALFDRIKSQLFALDANRKATGTELCRALAIRPDVQGKELLKELVNKSGLNIDVRAAAVYALMKQYPNE